jgi:hypothetical protein
MVSRFYKAYHTVQLVTRLSFLAVVLAYMGLFRRGRIKGTIQSALVPVGCPPEGTRGSLRPDHETKPSSPGGVKSP